ncbi:hypothetical protein D9Q98_009195 [Chlorella vulgaris]|uniref:Molybdenum cofactor sulfurase n=1 Tax=Chlorella vulgaris TaxID=3077 RepID=A0A9D4YX55_CHLVU|nr:hypothetical protein D9Q98_009195 [Chlorella vulgaris]
MQLLDSLCRAMATLTTLTSARLLSEPTVQPDQRESAAQEASMLDVLGESSAPGAAVEPPTQSHVPGQQQQEEQQQQEGQQQQASRQPAVPVGYNEGVDVLRQQEFCRLAGRVYADYAGTAPFSEVMLAEVFQGLSGSLLGNPHSEAGWAPEDKGSAAAAARLLTLRMCNADPERYTCIFTSGATAALKLVGESYCWREGSTFLYLRDNHTSVLGIRQLAAQHGAASAAVELTAASQHPGSISTDGSHDGCQLALCGQAAAARLEAAAAPAGEGAVAAAAAPRGSEGCSHTDQQPQHLFAYPAESNLSGVRYDPSLIAAVQQGCMQLHYGGSSGTSSITTSSLPAGRWRVLVDAAKACGSVPPDLSQHAADFVALSFYKMFGYPTGLGALLVRNDALPCLRRRYFGGGTVEVSLADEPFHSMRPGPAGWEDGTPPFLDFPAVIAGLAFIDRLGGFPAVAAHAGAVAASLAQQLTSLRHWNGAPVCMLYGSYEALLQPQSAARQQPGVVGQGPVVAFNLLRADGSCVGYREVEKLASLSGILLRTGCCCNPGACAAALGLTAEEMKANYAAGHMCWDDQDVINGRPTGLVRTSFGYASSLADAAAIVALVARYWQESTPPPPPSELLPAQAAAAGRAVGTSREQAAEARIAGLWVYPIKSCRGFSPPAWPLGPAGLLYDRCWVLVDSSGSALRLKQHPALASVQTSIDLERGCLLASAPGEARQLEVPLTSVAVPSSAASGGSADIGSIGSISVHGQHSGPVYVKQQPTQQPAAAAYSIRVCRRSARAERAGGGAGGEEEAAAWFSRVLGVPCRLMRLVEGAGRQGSEAAAVAPAAAAAAAAGAGARAGAGTAAGVGAAAGIDGQSGVEGFTARNAVGSSTAERQSFANDGQLLVLTAASLADLQARCRSDEAVAIFQQRFRPNIVISGPTAYAEDEWAGLHISAVLAPAGTTEAGAMAAGTAAAAAAGSGRASSAGDATTAAQPTVVLASVGACPRCDMVCADPFTGRRAGPEPLLTLASYRRSRGRISFGQLMEQQPQQQPSDQQQQQREASKEGTRLWLAVGASVRPITTDLWNRSLV